MTDPKVLRDFFNEIFSQNIKNIKQSYNLLNVSNKEDAYSLLEKEYKKYNKILEKENSKVIIQQAKEKVKTYSDKVLKTVKSKTSISQLNKSLISKIQQMKKNKLTSITIDLKNYKKYFTSCKQCFNSI